MTRLTSLLSASILLFATITRAADPLPPDKPVHEVVDHYMNAQLREEGVRPAPRAEDNTFIRRATLDLLGRIPTLPEREAFVGSSDPKKYEQLIDRLMSSPAFLRHQARELNTLLMDGTGGNLDSYLKEAVAENRSWDRIFREVMLPDQSDPKKDNVNEFLRRRAKDADELTNEISVIFFGVNVSCAKCHDHPLVHDWKQAHFFGMKSFLARTFDNGGLLAERGYGEVKYKTTKGEEHTADMMFLTGTVVDDPSAGKELSKKEQQEEKKRFEEFKKKKQAPPKPKFSAREQLVELALKPDQRGFFAKSIVNRVIYRLFGRGLVMPLDQMHSANPASHPQLLEWLARDTVEHGYDLRRLMRGLMLSETYARSSRWEGGDTPLSDTFAVAQVRPMTPMQLGASLQIAITDPKQFEDRKGEDLEKYLEGLEGRGRGLASNIEQPKEKFQISVDEALLFSNSEQVRRDLLNDGGDQLLHRLKAIDDDKGMIRLASRVILCREPEAEEAEAMLAFLSQRKDKREEAVKHLMWALLTSAEMRFNY